MYIDEYTSEEYFYDFVYEQSWEDASDEYKDAGNATITFEDIPF